MVDVSMPRVNQMYQCRTSTCGCWHTGGFHAHAHSLFAYNEMNSGIPSPREASTHCTPHTARCTLTPAQPFQPPSAACTLNAACRWCYNILKFERISKVTKDLEHNNYMHVQNGIHVITLAITAYLTQVHV